MGQATAEKQVPPKGTKSSKLSPASISSPAGSSLSHRATMAPGTGAREPGRDRCHPRGQSRSLGRRPSHLCLGGVARSIGAAPHRCHPRGQNPPDSCPSPQPPVGSSCPARTGATQGDRERHRFEYLELAGRLSPSTTSLKYVPGCASPSGELCLSSSGAPTSRRTRPSLGGQSLPSRRTGLAYGGQ